MTDTTETIALRLFAFIQAAERNASAGDFPRQVNTQPARSAPKAPILKAYEECLNKLEPAERGELDRMIQKMSGALGSPPGAIVPP